MPAAAQTATAAPGGPGAPSYFDNARKDCVGTAHGGSKVWYTVADGVLSDVYEPTIDNTNVATLQYVVTDGSSFTDLQTRDLTYTVAADPTGMVCTVTATSAKHHYQLVTTYLTDPARDTVLMRTQSARRHAADCASTPGWTRTSTATAVAAARTAARTPAPCNASTVRRARRLRHLDHQPGHQPRLRRAHLRRAARHHLTAPRSVGYAGTASDGLTAARRHPRPRHHLRQRAQRAHHRHRGRDPAPRTTPITLALGFGRTQSDAVSDRERLAEHPVPRHPGALPGRLARLRRDPAPTARARTRAGLLPQRERAESQ